MANEPSRIGLHPRTTSGSGQQRWPELALIAPLLGALGALAVPYPSAQAQDAAPNQSSKQRYDIEPGPLTEVLNRFAMAAGIEIAGAGKLTADRESQGLEGAYTVEEALDRLLEGTDLRYRMRDADTVVLASGADSQEELRAIQVTAGADRAYSPDGTGTGIGEGFGVSPLESPVSTSAVDQQLLEEQDSTRYREALRNVPGVDFDESYFGQYDEFRMRGFKLNTNKGAYQRNGTGHTHLQQSSFFTVERVEVLKGPASILNGSVNPGGVINRITYKPTTTPITRVQGSLDSYEQLDASVNTAGPIGDSGAAYRFIAGARDGETFKDKVNEEEQLLYGALRVPLGEETALTTNLEINHREDVVDDGLVAPDPNDPLDSVRNLPRSRFLGEDVTSEYENYHFDLGLETRFGAWDADVTYTYSRNRRDVRQVKPTSLDSDGRTVRRETNAFFTEPEWHTLDAEFRRSFETGPVRHRLGVGADYSRRTFEFSPNTTRTADPIDLFDPDYGGDAPFGSTSAFADGADFPEEFYGVNIQDVMRIGERWVALAGIRYDREEDDFSEQFESSEEEDEAWSPRAGVVYRATPTWSVYASYAESFEPISGASKRTGERWDPVEGEQIELGTKLELLRDASLTASAFELRRVNALIEDPNDPTFNIQGGERRSRGLELELAGRITENLDLRAGYTYLDTEIVKADNNEGNAFGQTPNNAANLWAGYRLEPRLRVGGGIFYTGDRYASDNNELELPSYTTVDLFARYDVSDSTNVQFNVDNFFDEKYIVDADNNEVGFFFGEPLTASVSLTHEF